MTAKSQKLTLWDIKVYCEGILYLLTFRIAVFLLILLGFASVTAGQDLIALLDQAKFTHKAELGIPGSVCLVSETDEKLVAMMWLWWGPERKITLSRRKLSDIFNRSIGMGHVKLLDRKGRLISSSSEKNGLELKLSKDPQYLLLEGQYEPLHTFPEDLSGVRVYLQDSTTVGAGFYAVFENLTANATIQILNATDQTVLEVTVVDRPAWSWDLKDLEGKSVPAGTYRYRIFAKSQAVSGKLSIGN